MGTEGTLWQRDELRLGWWMRPFWSSEIQEWMCGRTLTPTHARKNLFIPK